MIVFRTEGGLILDQATVLKALEEVRRFKADVNNLVIGMPELVDLTCEAALSRQHVFMLSEPGLGKTYLARYVVNGFTGGAMYAMQFNAHTKPREINGPLDLSGLDEKPSVERYNTAGYLPEATGAVLDEMFKAGSEVLNSLLGMLNERIFRDGAGERVCPLDFAIAASNEYPEAKELDALYDRILYRYYLVDQLDSDQFMQVMSVSARAYAGTLPGCNFTPPPPPKPVDPDALRVLRTHLGNIVDPATWTQQSRTVLLTLRAAFGGISPRRWGQAITAVASRAVMCGAGSVLPEHFEALRHVLWNRHDEQPDVDRVINETLVRQAVNPLDTMLAGLIEKKASLHSATPGEATTVIIDMLGILNEMKAQAPDDERTIRAQALHREAAGAMARMLGDAEASR